MSTVCLLLFSKLGTTAARRLGIIASGVSDRTRMRCCAHVAARQRRQSGQNRHGGQPAHSRVLQRPGWRRRSAPMSTRKPITTAHSCVFDVQTRTGVNQKVICAGCCCDLACPSCQPRLHKKAPSAGVSDMSTRVCLTQHTVDPQVTRNGCRGLHERTQSGGKQGVREKKRSE